MRRRMPRRMCLAERYENGARCAYTAWERVGPGSLPEPCAWDHIATLASDVRNKSNAGGIAARRDHLSVHVHLLFCETGSRPANQRVNNCNYSREGGMDARDATCPPDGR